MKIAVFGTGAVGGYFGGRLAQTGEEVTFIARGENLRTIREHGLRVDSIKGDFCVQPCGITSDTMTVGIVDAILVAVKAWQVPEAAQAIRPMIGPNTFVVPLENGVEAPDQIAGVLGKGPVLGGLCRIISMMVGPGHVRHAGAEPSIAFGELDNRHSPRAERLRDVFSRAGVSVQVPPDIHAAMWEKFLFIASVSGVGAVTRAALGVIRSIPETRLLLEQAMREVYEVARARGIGLGENSVNKVMGFVDNLPPDGTASMQRDIQEGRPSELESQNGAVVRLGRQAGVKTPIHEFLYSSLLPAELKARGQ
jgi:2-dehydropantoate 2-reductase